MWLPDEDELHFYGIDDRGNLIGSANLCVTENLDEREFCNMSFLLRDSYSEILEQLEELYDINSRTAALKYGWASLPTQGNAQGWRYHDKLGFRKRI